MRLFQSTRPHGARQLGEMLGSGIAEFQSTRPHGARHYLLAARQQRCNFNPRAHTGRDYSRFFAGTSSMKFQSTRPHGARPSDMIILLSICHISIHAPTRGATLGAVPIRDKLAISIHAPTRGATMARRIALGFLIFQSTRPHGARRDLHFLMRNIGAFQSTRPHGARPYMHLLLKAHTQISIHAPTRGATEHRYTGFLWRQISIHAPTRGATTRAHVSGSITRFQSTRPHGARPHGMPVSGASRHFNPRAHTGRDVSPNA